MRRRKTADHKLMQLCAQVEEAIDLALGASSDPLLQGCWVAEVTPVPTARRLCVHVQTQDSIGLKELEKALKRATPWLRSEVAEFISRKKTPELLLVQVSL